MIFNSLEFLVLFVVTFSVYWTLRHRAQNLFLLGASYFFYGWWDWTFLGLIAGSTLVDYCCGLSIAGSEDPKRRRFFLGVSLAVNLGALGVCKYFDFFLGSLYGALETIGVGDGERTLLLELVVPVGISFYTFQSLSYTIDVFRGRLEPTASLTDFALYVAFFPQLVAGPIERASDMLPQVAGARELKSSAVLDGLSLMAFGMFKKVVVADNISRLITPVYTGIASASSLEIAVAGVAFMAQIYFDFSGYTDIARGTAQTLGFRLKINFNKPYCARNPVEFWERWHMSLSSWVRDYLFFPLALHYMRKTTGWLNAYKPHLIAMTIVGLWHGADVKFIVFGAYWGAAMCLYNAFRERAPNVPGAVMVATNLVVVWFSFLVFRVNDLPELKHLWQNSSLPTQYLCVDHQTLTFFGLAIILVGSDFLLLRKPSLGVRLATQRSPAPRLALTALAILACLFFRSSGVPFIYFQF